jgi:hypothetical protein
LPLFRCAGGARLRNVPLSLAFRPPLGDRTATRFPGPSIAHPYSHCKPSFWAKCAWAREKKEAGCPLGSKERDAPSDQAALGARRWRLIGVPWGRIALGQQRERSNRPANSPNDKSAIWPQGSPRRSTGPIWTNILALRDFWRPPISGESRQSLERWRAARRNRG